MRCSLNGFEGVTISDQSGTVSPVLETERSTVEATLRESIETQRALAAAAITHIAAAGACMRLALHKGGRVIAFGNGGSAAEAQHLVAELIGRFEVERHGLPAMSLTSDSAIVTAVANDYGYDQLFARQMAAVGTAGDVAVAISTSGSSPSVVNGARSAREQGIAVIGLGGICGTPLQQESDHFLSVPSRRTARIQEGHLLIIHALCEIIDMPAAS